jgi:multidrug efflux pump subunit AcrA (membrane-fusion protein)
VAEFNVDEAETEKFLADKALVEANEALELSKAELRRAQAYLALKHIKSPFDGVVVDRYSSPGERVDEDPILKLAKINPLYVEVLLPIEMLGKIQVGLEGVVTTEFDSGKELMATVVVVDRVVDAASGLFGVRLELPNPDLNITAGLECHVAFSLM